MYRAVLAACLLGFLVATPLIAQEMPSPCAALVADPPSAERSPAVPSAPAIEYAEPPAPPTWETVWGIVGLRAFFDGPKEAPNGQEYHPSFTLDLNFNFWVWRTQGLYIFSDMRFWGERPEYNVTNGKDGGLGFSKREFDMVGGPAWNYYGAWEARLYGYTYNNLNRGIDNIHPSGLNDGFVLENRYYLSGEYAKLGKAGFDVSRADFVSVGYYITKDLVGNDGQIFNPGLMLRAYLTCDLWNWPAYVYGDFNYISERSLEAKLFLFDIGVAARPFCLWPSCSAWQNWELRLGAENTADFTTSSVLNLWYVTARVIF